MPDIIELVRKGFEDEEPVAYACGKCGVVNASKGGAERCWCRPRPCPTCDEMIPGKGAFCHPCAQAKYVGKLEAQMAKATKLTYAQWCETCAEGEMLTDGEEFWHEWPYPDYVDEPVEWLWATTFKPVFIGNGAVEDLLENVAEEYHEGINDDLDSAVLDAAVAKWNEDHKTVGSWFEDRDRAVLAPADEGEEDDGE